ncbi:hypothetical protein MTR67_039740 [Solanum verrucosum]|uniref:Integrase catalytic domain-containing protein n=1 Tax=Solanum verrucosum TaxID=315347 RepID=A0AAF0ZR12_SOLVR|nr:hypothetical protein MTR67_039740 [Solanum verrucosum]
MRLHRVPLFIIFDCGTLFTSQFWRSFQKVLVTQVKLSTTFDHQIDGYHSSIKMDPFEAVNDRIIDLLLVGLKLMRSL